MSHVPSESSHPHIPSPSPALPPSAASPARSTVSATVSSPDAPGAHEPHQEVDPVLCRWDGCGQTYTTLPGLVTHLHNDHIGTHKSAYVCQWDTCGRKGLNQTNRFTLISHLRSHTGEKPYTCRRPECDKSFTRSDALAKHMRQQHGVPASGPGRHPNPALHPWNPHIYDPNAAAAAAAAAGYPGQSQSQYHSSIGYQAASSGAGKRKRSNSVSSGDSASPQAPAHPAAPPSHHAPLHSHSQSHHPSYQSGPPPPGFIPIDPPRDPSPASSRSTPSPSPFPGAPRSQPGPSAPGYPPYFAKYMAMKAKLRYIVAEHETMVDELEAARREEARLKEEKERLLDRVLEMELGADAIALTGEVFLPQDGRPPPWVKQPERRGEIHYS